AGGDRGGGGGARDVGRSSVGGRRARPPLELRVRVHEGGARRVLPGSRRRAGGDGSIGDDRAARLRAHEDDRGRGSGPAGGHTGGGGGSGRAGARTGVRDRVGPARAALGEDGVAARPPAAVPQAPDLRMHDPHAGAERVVAAFDFDKTISTRDNVMPFLRAVMGRVRLARALLAISPRLVRAALDDDRRDAAKVALLRHTLTGCEAAPVTEVAAGFASDVLATPAARRRRPRAVAPRPGPRGRDRV